MESSQKGVNGMQMSQPSIYSTKSYQKSKLPQKPKQLSENSKLVLKEFIDQKTKKYQKLFENEELESPTKKLFEKSDREFYKYLQKKNSTLNTSISKSQNQNNNVHIVNNNINNSSSINHNNQSISNNSNNTSNNNANNNNKENNSNQQKQQNNTHLRHQSTINLISKKDPSIQNTRSTSNIKQRPILQNNTNNNYSYQDCSPKKILKQQQSQKNEKQQQQQNNTTTIQQNNNQQDPDTKNSSNSLFQNTQIQDSIRRSNKISQLPQLITKQPSYFLQQSQQQKSYFDLKDQCKTIKENSISDINKINQNIKSLISSNKSLLLKKNNNTTTSNNLNNLNNNNSNNNMLQSSIILSKNENQNSSLNNNNINDNSTSNNHMQLSQNNNNNQSYMMMNSSIVMANSSKSAQNLIKILKHSPKKHTNVNQYIDPQQQTIIKSQKQEMDKSFKFQKQYRSSQLLQLQEHINFNKQLRNIQDSQNSIQKQQSNDIFNSVNSDRPGYPQNNHMKKHSHDISSPAKKSYFTPRQLRYKHINLNKNNTNNTNHQIKQNNNNTNIFLQDSYTNKNNKKPNRYSNSMTDRPSYVQMSNMY